MRQGNHKVYEYNETKPCVNGRMCAQSISSFGFDFGVLPIVSR